MQIAAANASFRPGPDTGQRRPAPAARSECRALVPLAPAGIASPRTAAPTRPVAAFLAHLIATAQGAPQTRERRRAEPADAIARYALQARALAHPSIAIHTM
ncbi:MAG: hypothetical protein AB7K35_03780 [Pseudorhodoplanes sp.]